MMYLFNWKQSVEGKVSLKGTTSTLISEFKSLKVSLKETTNTLISELFKKFKSASYSLLGLSATNSQNDQMILLTFFVAPMDV